MKSSFRIIGLATLIALLLPQLTMAAAVFDPNYILSDFDLANSDSMSVDRIQSFLTAKGNLGSVTATDPNGISKTAAQIINEVAQNFRISPQYLIVRMQIEQSLITTSNITQRRLDWATGYGCPDSTGCSNPTYQGFYNQVNWAAQVIRDYYLPQITANGQKNGWGPGIANTSLDGYTVTPANAATAALYVYTPHVYNANYNIWYYLNTWFARVYPEGSLLRARGEAGVYLIQNGQKRPFYTKSALVSRYNPNNVIVVEKNVLDAYEKGPKISLPNYSLIQSDLTKEIYLIDGNALRHIVSEDVFRAIGFNPEEVITVADSEIATYQTGVDITRSDNYPTGILLQSKKSGGIAYIQDGIRHPIFSSQIFKDRFGGQKPQRVNDSVLLSYPRGTPVLFRDGTLVTSPKMKGGIYVISNGERRPIKSKKIFNAFGYQSKNVIKTTDDALLAHPLGAPLEMTP